MGTGSVRSEVTTLIRQVQGVWSPEPEGQLAFPQILRQRPEVSPDPMWGRGPLQVDVLAGGPQSAQGPHTHLTGLRERAPSPLGSGGRRHPPPEVPGTPQPGNGVPFPQTPSRARLRPSPAGEPRAHAGLSAASVRGGPLPPWSAPATTVTTGSRSSPPPPITGDDDDASMTLP